MSTSKQPKERKARFPINFLECTTNNTETASLTDPLVYYKLLDVGEEGKITHQGRSITVNVDTLVDIDKLGQGHFGNVMLAEVTDGPDTIRMAVKRLNLLRSTNNLNEYSTETDLRTIRAVGSGINPHVTKFFTAFVDHGKIQLLICMEACETSMEKFYRAMHQLKETRSLDLLLKRMINHIVDALKFLKTKNILHRDVKPSNILINQNPVIFKLCDFGICGTLVDSVSGTMMIGTHIYLAPERIDRNLSPRGYGIRSDMWSLGLSAIEIATNKHPFHKMEGIAILNRVITWVPELPPNLSPELGQLIIWLVRENQADRPNNYDDVLETPAMRSLPIEITDGESEMVKNVIKHIPQTAENN